jgi:hypothetical protein
MSPPAFLWQQVLTIGPLSAAIWLSGLWAGAARPQLATSRMVAVAWILLMLVFEATHGKAYYLAPIYPALLAFGAVRLEQWGRSRIVRGAVLAGVAGAGAATAPFTLPILPVETFVRYQKAIGFMPSAGEHQTIGVLPQYYADMFGWPQMAAKVADVYRSLPPADKGRAVFFGDNYGEAAAIDVFGRRLGLPPAISGHNSYFLWGPRGHDGSVVIIVGGRPEHYAELFRKVDVAGRLDAPYAMPYEANEPIYVLRDMKQPLQSYWPAVKHYQ